MHLCISEVAICDSHQSYLRLERENEAKRSKVGLETVSEDQVHDYEETKKQLQIARDLSIGKEWRVEKELDRPQDTIFRETSSLLYRILLRLGAAVRGSDPQRSVRLCAQALRRAADSNKPHAEAEVLYQLGISYHAAQEYNQALEVFKKYLILSEQDGDVSGQCNAVLKMAKCHSNLGDEDTTLHLLSEHLTRAKASNVPELMAAAHRSLGEFLLNKGSAQEASSHLVTAFTLYHELGSAPAELEPTRALAAIAAGQELMPSWADLILASSLQRQVNWKDSRTPFWDADISSASFQQE